jgi:glycogen synthase
VRKPDSQEFFMARPRQVLLTRERIVEAAAALVDAEGLEAVSVRRLATELGVAGRLRWEPGLSQPELAERYRRAAALLVPGSHEGLGLVAVEGQLSGAAVIAAASGGLLDVVVDGRTGWTFPPGDPTALATAIQEVADHPAEAAGRAAAARQAAADRFSPVAAARAYATIYAEAIDTHARSRRPAAGAAGAR